MHLELTKNSATIVTVICLPHIVLSFHSNYSHPLAPHKTSVTEYPLQIGKFEMHSEILSILKINPSMFTQRSLCACQDLVGGVSGSVCVCHDISHDINTISMYMPRSQ